MREGNARTWFTPGQKAELWEAGRPVNVADFAGGLEQRLDYSNAKMRFQSFFMLITVQPFFFASS
jgi:hypothetical protein